MHAHDILPAATFKCQSVFSEVLDAELSVVSVFLKGKLCLTTQLFDIFAADKHCSAQACRPQRHPTSTMERRPFEVKELSGAANDQLEAMLEELTANLDSGLTRMNKSMDSSNGCEDRVQAGNAGFKEITTQGTWWR